MLLVPYTEFWDCVEFHSGNGLFSSDRPNPSLLAERSAVTYEKGGYFMVPARCLNTFVGRATNPKDCMCFVPVALCRFWQRA